MIETPESFDFGGTRQGIHPYKPDTHGRLRTRRVLRSLGSSARSPWRRREPGVDSQEAPCARDTVEDFHAKLRAVAGIAVLIALMAVGTAAAGAQNATVRHPGVERLIDSSSGSDPDVTQVVSSSRDQLLRSRPSSSTSELEQVDLFGDSLGYQVEPYLDTFFAHSHDYTVSDYTYGGTATCDWLNTMESAAAQRPQDALFVFSGNAFTPCMDGVALRSPQYYDLYTAYTEQAIGIFSAVGAHVFLVGTPVDESSVVGWDQLDDIYRQLAQASPLTVTYVDAGASVETATGGFTWALPCISIEPSCGHDGTNVVRSPDGIHFCPEGTPATLGVTGPCEEYSSGAFRFALAMMNAVTQYAYSTPGDK
jgi:hypothetical protein